MKTLVLTPWMSPFLIVPWQTAITMMHLGKVDLLEQYNDEVCNPGITSVFVRPRGVRSREGTQTR